MCGIYGVIGNIEDICRDKLSRLRQRVKDRGRDGIGEEEYSLQDGRIAIIGACRATPTPEPTVVPPQPYDGIVHNGTIANDVELGGVEGKVDSLVLPNVLSRQDISSLANSVQKIKGSFALAVVNDNTIFLACNYKPIHYWSDDGKTVWFASLERHLNDIVPAWHSAKLLQPYSVLDITSWKQIQFRAEPPKRACVLASGGLDSTVVATKLVREGYDVCLLHCQYGCTAETQEYDRIKRISELLSIPMVTLKISYNGMKGNCPILTGGKISSGIEGAEWAHEWVPGRNLLMLSYAAAYAEANDYHYLAFGNNLEESGAYPDNEEQMTILMNTVMNYSVNNMYVLRIISPVGNLMKHEIVKLGNEINAPLDLTWSCYTSQKKHCGKCGPCFMRREAFRRNNLDDPVFSDA